MADVSLQEQIEAVRLMAASPDIDEQVRNDLRAAAATLRRVQAGELVGRDIMNIPHDAARRIREKMAAAGFNTKVDLHKPKDDE